ncbi:MAG: hypothetical protein LC714_03090 [Actinobacteria bacterium]|nr:hypothetical protein [Actinomycetota bacterium]
MSVLGASVLFWLLALFALGSAWFFVGALRDQDSQLAWYSAIAFVLLSAAAVAELTWRLP